MQHFIDRLLSEPVMDAMLVVAFSLAILGFWARIRRDKRTQRDKVHDKEQTPSEQ